MRRFLAATLLLASPAFAQQKPQENVTPAMGSITGTVLCDDTHAPARAATVELLSFPEENQRHARIFTPQAHTDIYGHFVMDKIPVGEYVLTAFYPGYLNPLELNTDPKLNLRSRKDFTELAHKIGTVTVTENTTAGTTITLVRGATVTGRVLYADGSPAPLVDLILQDTRIANDSYDQRRSVQESQGHATDDQGRFRLSGLPPGSFRIAARLPHQTARPGIAFPAMPDKDSDLLLYSGNTFHKAAADVVDLRPREEIAIADITIPLGALHAVVGTVKAADGTPLNAGDVTLQHTSDNSMDFQAFIESEGNFVFDNVPPGTYELSFENMAIAENHSTHDAKSSTTWIARTRAFTNSKQTLIITDTDPAPIQLVPTEFPIDPAIKKRDAEQPPPILPH